MAKEIVPVKEISGALGAYAKTVSNEDDKAFSTAFSSAVQAGTERIKQFSDENLKLQAMQSQQKHEQELLNKHEIHKTLRATTVSVVAITALIVVSAVSKPKEA